MLQFAVLFDVLNLIPSIGFDKNNDLDRKIFTVQLQPVPANKKPLFRVQPIVFEQ